MNLCEALEKSRYVTTPARGGFITPARDPIDGFQRVVIDHETGLFYSQSYRIDLEDLKSDDWVPCSVEISYLPLDGSDGEAPANAAPTGKYEDWDEGDDEPEPGMVDVSVDISSD
jgi:hypothetical protein